MAGYYLRMTIHLVSCCLEEGNLSYPLGALCIQSSLLAKGFACVHHPFTLADNPRQAAGQVAYEQGEVIGLSVYLWNRLWMDSFLSALKEEHPGLVVFAGGPEATANPQSFNLDSLSFLVVGEGEEAVVQAVQQLAKHQAVQGKGLVSDLKYISYAPSPQLSGLSSPILQGLADPFLTEGASVLWEMTRGCPFHCSFCFESRGQRSVRHFPPERLEAELDYLVAHGVGEIYVLDPTFNMDKKRTLELLSLIEAKSQAIHFVFEIRAELLDKQLADAFSRINCSLQIGLQSSDPAVLKQANRSFVPDSFAKKVALLNDRGIPFGLDLIIGLPLDSFEAFTKSLDYAMALKPSNLDIFPLSLLPGTLVADQAAEFGIKHLKDAPYTIQSSPTFCEEDLLRAIRLKEAADLFFTQGQAGMWMGKLGEALELKGHQILTLFNSYLSFYLKKSGQRQEEIDIFSVQEAFVRSLLKKLGKQAYEPALLSYMELHQGIAFIQTYQESPVIRLLYSLDELSLLDRLSLEEFVRTYPEQEQQEFAIQAQEDGQLLFIPLK